MSGLARKKPAWYVFAIDDLKNTPRLMEFPAMLHNPFVRTLKAQSGSARQRVASLAKKVKILFLFHSPRTRIR